MNYAHKSWWQIFEVIFGIPFIVAMFFQYFVPASLPNNFAAVRSIIGGALLIIGIILVVFARREFALHGQPTDPGLPTSKIVTTGVFSISRNPLYLGGVCFLAGIAIVVNWPWVLFLLPPSIIACHYLLIAPEERYLADKFGNEYLAYTAQVHRWIGRVYRNK
jgi:protein-S-isoprenylcysteine O-methyltransferase Ste14